jgi:Flp pilus assembly protein TadG
MPPAGSGQALAELAIMAPILLVILMATAQLGTILATQIGISNAVREAAREASVVPTLDAGSATVNGSWAADRLVTALLPGAPSFDAARLTSDTGTAVCYRPSTDPDGAANVLVDVRAAYRHALWLPIVGPLLDGIDGVSDGALRIGVDQEMRVENDTAPTLDATVCVP